MIVYDPVIKLKSNKINKFFAELRNQANDEE